MKKALRETQTLRAGCSKADPKFFAHPQTPFPVARDGQNLISCRQSNFRRSPRRALRVSALTGMVNRSYFRGNDPFFCRPFHQNVSPSPPSFVDYQLADTQLFCRPDDCW